MSRYFWGKIFVLKNRVTVKINRHFLEFLIFRSFFVCDVLPRVILGPLEDGNKWYCTDPYHLDHQAMSKNLFVKMGYNSSVNNDFQK